MTRAKLEAELAEIKARGEAREQARRIDARRAEVIQAALARMDLAVHVGRPLGMVVRFRGGDDRIPPCARGTLTKIGRRYLSIDLGDLGTWQLPRGWVEPVTGPLAEVLP